MRHRLKATLTAALVITVACSDAAGPSGPPNTLRFTAPPETVRQGEPASFAVEVFDDTGTPIEQAALSWSVEPFGAGDFPLDARFVGYQPGPVTVIVSHGPLADTIAFEILARAVPAGSLTTVGRGFQTGPWNTDLWVHGNIAYTGTFSRGSNRGDRIFIWDVAAPANPMLLGSFVVDAAAVNDVKIRSDGRVAVLTHEGSTDGRNGVSLIDVQDPTAPRLITRQDGIYAVDATGELLGRLDRQGRTIMQVNYIQESTGCFDIIGNDTCTWAPQLHNGLLYVSDVNSGLWIFRPEFSDRPYPEHGSGVSVLAYGAPSTRQSRIHRC